MNKKVSYQSELKRDHFRVSIFGSARIKRGDPIYKNIKKLAFELGKRDIDVVTGGGPGLMEAANRGHRLGSKNNESHSIGLNIRLPHEQKPNTSIDVLQGFNIFSNRLDNFMLLSDAVIVAPGGIGTALEFLYTWQLIQTKKICNIPIIFIGSMWDGLIEWFRNYPMKKKYLDKEDLEHIFVCKNNQEILKIIDKVKEKYGKDVKICRNHEKYSLKKVMKKE